MKRRIIAMLMSGLMLCGVSGKVLAIGLGAAGEFNTFIFEDFTASHSDTEGRLAVGGNANLTGYSVGDKLSSDFQGAGLVVGGNLAYNGGQVFNGDVYVSGQVNSDATILNGTLNQGKPLPIDFNAEREYLTNLATNLAGYASTGIVDNKYGGLYLSGTKDSSLQTFNLDGTDLLHAHTFQFDTTSIDEDATVVFNISGTETGLTNMGLDSLRSIHQNVLFNFYEATDLTFGGIGIQGSVLAPFAAVNSPSGQIDGTMIVKSWNALNDGGLEQHYVPFNGSSPTPPSTVPEPGTILLLGAGLLGIFSIARRRCQ